jgi:hypothetical protein
VIRSLIVKKRLLLLGFALVAAPVMHAQDAIGEVFSSDASVRGSVVLSGNGAHVLSGSQVAAGEGVALLKLERGGEVRICPRTNLSLSVDPGGKALVLGLNAGSMELDYSLQTAADMLITPDFRLQLISPGTFHLAISVAPSGDTCLRSLPGNDAATFVAEMMGNGSYQLSPGKNVMFRAGKISGATDAPPVCGCPALKAEMLTPTADAPPAAPPAVTAEDRQEAVRKAAQTAAQEANQEAAQKNAAEPHMEVESTFVYHGSEAVQDYYASVARLSLSTDNSGLALALLPQVSGPVEKTTLPGKKPGRLHRLRSFLGRLLPR